MACHCLTIRELSPKSNHGRSKLSMAVRLEFINLIIPIHTIEENYPGGFSSYKIENLDMFGRRLWHDDHLFRDGAMDPMSAESLVRFWSDQGLEPFEQREGRKSWKDMCVVEGMFRGLTLPCEWLEYDRENNCVFLKGTDKGAIIGKKF
jgi:hypothetical protein